MTASPTKIDRFKDAYSWLSNMHEFDGFVYGNLHFTSTESFYQAMKTMNLTDRKRISQMNGYNAKREGKKIHLRDDWEEVKDDVMLFALRLKFKNAKLRKKLLDTGDSLLIEGNFHGDHYWGVCKGLGLNKLGLFIMQVREEIRAGEQNDS